MANDTTPNPKPATLIDQPSPHTGEAEIPLALPVNPVLLPGSDPHDVEPPPMPAAENRLNEVVQQLSAMADRLQQSEGALFRASTTLENDLKDVTRGVRAQLTTRFLKDVIRVLNNIKRHRLQTLEEVEDQLSEMLQLYGLVPIQVNSGDSFEPKFHRSISTESTTDQGKHKTVFRICSTGWLREEDNYPFVPAEVIVYDHRP